MRTLFRTKILQMSGYTPGEQPREGEVLKLNTNENPYPPSPRVLEAIQSALTSEKLRKYPDPIGREFCQTVADVLQVDPDSVLIGNGSDDILTIVTRATVPENGLISSPTPSYVLYRTLADIQGANLKLVPFEDWQLPSTWPHPNAHLTLVPNPNSPSGTVVALSSLEDLANQLEGLLVVDEAYADFAESNALSLSTMENVIVTRTLSKSYSLAGIRFGFGIARPDLIRELVKVKDSYNCDVLSLAAATAALQDQEHFRQTRKKILATREPAKIELENLGFEVTPSEANFLWCRAARDLEPIYLELKRRQILVRYMKYPDYGEGLRITIGTDDEMNQLFTSLRAIV